MYGLIPHEGIVYSLNWNYDTQEWEIKIAHLSKSGGGVCVSSLEEFAEGNTVDIIGWATSPESQEWIVENINIALRWQLTNGGIPYHVHDQNCQHFTSWAYGEKPNSKSLDVLKVAAGVGVAIWFWGRKN
jgi:hypothetical protein